MWPGRVTLPLALGSDRSSRSSGIEMRSGVRNGRSSPQRAALWRSMARCWSRCSAAPRIPTQGAVELLKSGFSFSGHGVEGRSPLDVLGRWLIAGGEDPGVHLIKHDHSRGTPEPAQQTGRFTKGV